MCDSDGEGFGRRCVDHLLVDLQSLFTRYSLDYNITTVEFVGCLEVMKHEILLCVNSDDDEDDPEDA